MGLVSLVLGLGFLMLYLVLAGPTFYWLDSSELVAAAWGLGVAHPPGHPLASLLSRLVCLLPLGTISFRVTLASALQAAGAVALCAVLSHQVLDRMRRGWASAAPAWVAPGAACLAACLLGLSFSLGLQAVRAEVYALNLLCLLGAACLLLRWDTSGDRRALLAAALVLGLALCNHHFLVLLALPAMALFVLARRPGPGLRRAACMVVLAGALGLVPLVYLPLRAATDPQVNWGAPSNLQRFGWVVSARAFHKSLDRAASQPLSDRAEGALFAVVGGLGPVGALLALAGLYFMWRQRGSRRPALLLTLGAGLNLLSPLTVGFDPENPDAHGYLAVAVAFAAPGVAVLLFLLAGAAARVIRSRAAPALVLLAGAALPLVQGVINLPRLDLREHWAAEETARQVLSHQPPAALLLTSHFETIFNLWAVRATGDLRPDLTVIHRNFLSQPGYTESQARRHPGLATLLSGWERAGRVLASDLDRLVEQGRSIALEYDLNVPPEITRRLQPAGLLLAYGGRPAGLAQHRRRVEAWHAALGLDDPKIALEQETRRTLTWTHYLLTRFACQRVWPELARYHLGRALQLAPQSRELFTIAHRCGLADLLYPPGGG